MFSFHILPNRPNLSKKQFLAKIDFPHLYFEGNYDMTVNVLFIKYKGKGVIAGNFSEYWVTRCFREFIILKMFQSAFTLRLNYGVKSKPVKHHSYLSHTIRRFKSLWHKPPHQIILHTLLKLFGDCKMDLKILLTI